MLVNSGLNRRSSCLRFMGPLSGPISVMSLPVSSRYCSEARPRSGARSVKEFAASRSSIKDVSPDKGVKSLISCV